jgi:hypothetical protein
MKVMTRNREGASQSDDGAESFNDLKLRFLRIISQLDRR